MMKFILFITALLALVCSNKALKCYTCREPNYDSSHALFNNLQICDNNIEKSPARDISDLSFPTCKKFEEKINIRGQEQTLIIRTFELKDDPFKLDKNVFKEYSCNTDLCNSGTYSRAAWVTVFLSLAILISFNI